MNASTHSLDQLETDVLARIARHRNRRSSAALPVGVTLALLAMSVGILIGWSQSAQLATRGGSESMLLADDARLAPAELLASN
jgi:hypothetical protein